MRKPSVTLRWEATSQTREYIFTSSLTLTVWYRRRAILLLAAFFTEEQAATHKEMLGFLLGD
jgi:hypothetical protein